METYGILSSRLHFHPPSRNVMKSIEATLSMQCTWWKAIDLHWLCSTYTNDKGTSSTHQDLRPSTKVRNLYSLHKWCPQIALIVFVLMHGNGIVRISIGLMPVVSWGAPPLLLADVLLSEYYVPSITLHTGLLHDFLFNFNVHFEWHYRPGPLTMRYIQKTRVFSLIIFDPRVRLAIYTSPSKLLHPLAENSFTSIVRCQGVRPLPKDCTTGV